MKKTNRSTGKLLAFVLFGAAIPLIFSLPAWGAEQEPSWRPTYDVIMMWVNFLILFGVLYKFLKTPLQDFILGKKYEMEKEIQKAEEQKEKAEQKIKDSMRMLEEGEDRFKRIKERIIAQGEKKKAQIIEDAQSQSKYMLNEAKRKIDSQIVRARENFRKQLVDIAFDKALERLPALISEEDNEKFANTFIKNASSS